MNTLNSKREQSDRWKQSFLISSMLSTCLFSIWVTIVLVIISAPVWAWICAGFYVFSHWFHYFTWLGSAAMQARYEEALNEEDRTKRTGNKY